MFEEDWDCECGKWLGIFHMVAFGPVFYSFSLRLWCNVREEKRLSENMNLTDATYQRLV